MTATLILVRHAATGHLGHTLSGRTPGVPLSAEGRVQAAALASRVAALRPALVLTSPVQRARETAAALDPTPQVAGALDEVDFGRWAGRRFDELEGDPDWARWNAERGSARAGGGETMEEVRARVSALLRATAARHPEATTALVSHADVIRAAVADVLGLPLGHLLRFDVDPASMTTILMGDGWARLVRLNEVA